MWYKAYLIKQARAVLIEDIGPNHPWRQQAVDFVGKENLAEYPDDVVIKVMGRPRKKGFQPMSFALPKTHNSRGNKDER